MAVVVAVAAAAAPHEYCSLIPWNLRSRIDSLHLRLFGLLFFFIARKILGLKLRGFFFDRERGFAVKLTSLVNYVVEIIVCCTLVYQFRL